MSYCRFLEGDVYMYASVHGGIECCACRLADKVKTIFSPGVNFDKDDSRKEWVKGEVCTCKNGCDGCMMHGNTHLKTYKEAIDHLKQHEAAGHEVPKRAFEGLKADMKNGTELAPSYCDNEKCGEIAMVFDLKNGVQKCINCALGD